MRTANGTVDLRSNQDGDLCEQVGTTILGRHIWRWTGPAVSEAAPVELVFTNHDLVTDIMPFANGGYYNYDRLLYKADDVTGIVDIEHGTWNIEHGTLNMEHSAGALWYSLDGRKASAQPTQKGLYIHGGKKVVMP